MQRSRRALLQRRAMEKAIGRKRLYKLSISSIIVLWGFIFVFNLWNTRGDGYRGVDGGRSQSLLVNNSTWKDSMLHSNAARHVIREVQAELSCQSSGSNHAVDEDSEESESQGIGIDRSGFNINSGRRDVQKNDRMAQVAELDFDEFKTKEINSKNNYVGVSAGRDVLRVEPGGAKYNYASSGKGAKVLESNKESKGASNTLVKDKDKYLRNPCSAEEKFVIMELSEETLVSVVQVANFEHYSSNPKEFEILGSLVYPTDSWVKLGSFTAENVKHAQTFPLPEPKSVRYLKLNLLSHYGSEFYCTLSSIEVYGVDAVEWMLEDLISVSDYSHPPREVGNEHEDINGDVDSDSVLDFHQEGTSAKCEPIVNDVHDPMEKVNPQVGRNPGDSVLKILMQKVRALDLNLSILERYLEELNSRYRAVFKEFDEEMEAKDGVIETTRLNIRSLLDDKNAMTKNVEDLLTWKSQVSIQMDAIIKDNINLRSEVMKVQQKQMYMESKGILIFLTSMILSIIALTMMCINMVSYICRSNKPRKFWSTHTTSWVLLLISCITIMIILSL